MGIEAELKARVHEPQRVRDLLRHRGMEEVSVYYDTYFDTRAQELTGEGRELRVRVVHTDTSATTLLTYKGAAVDAASGSKPETETMIDDDAALRTILTALGFTEIIALEKHCSNYRFTVNGRSLLATLVDVPELEGSYIEVETIVDAEAEIDQALTTIRTVLGELGIARADETTETYTDAVAALRE